MKEFNLMKKLNRGMTLIEIIIVLSLMIVISGFFAKNVIAGKEASKRSLAVIRINSVLIPAVVTYLNTVADVGTRGLADALLPFTSNLNALVSSGILSADALKDPWGNNYISGRVGNSSLEIKCINPVAAGGGTTANASGERFKITHDFAQYI
jgi:prepilin-type N-terminal cleavage/methylation domain-containing protein